MPFFTPSHSARLTGGSLIDLVDYQLIRDTTEILARPLSPEDQVIQSMPDTSPTKWHRAHVTWFFETFVLVPYLPGYTVFDPDFQYLYNSYYEAVGDRHPRAERGMISRPPLHQIAAYRAHVDEAMDRCIRTVAAHDREVADLIVLGMHHEQQHQELLLMDIKHVFSLNPLRPKYHEQNATKGVESGEAGWVDFDGGLVAIGHRDDQDGRFHFDNEGPRHQTFLQPYRLADRLVTCGEWLNFMADDGYHESSYWLSEGWATICTKDWEAPMYWEATASGWQVHTLHGMQAVDPSEPVCHISYFEADAYARWADARLPTEAEWEHAAAALATDVDLTETADLTETNDAGTGRFHPVPAAPASKDGELRQLFGDVWEWTSGSYSAYPGFRPAAGAVGEYNGKFMVNQYVLRGGCCATPPRHTRATYRNFFPAHSRWMFSGLRLASDQ